MILIKLGKIMTFWDQVEAHTCILTKQECKHGVVTDMKE